MPFAIYISRKTKHAAFWLKLRFPPTSFPYNGIHCNGRRVFADGRLSDERTTRAYSHTRFAVQWFSHMWSEDIFRYFIPMPMARQDSSMYLKQLINSLMSFSMQLIYTLLSSLLICTVSIDRSFDLSMIPIFFSIFSNQFNDPFPCEHRRVCSVVRCGMAWPGRIICALEPKRIAVRWETWGKNVLLFIGKSNVKFKINTILFPAY